jgi:hypothetical protein
MQLCFPGTVMSREYAGTGVRFAVGTLISPRGSRCGSIRKKERMGAVPEGGVSRFSWDACEFNRRNGTFLVHRCVVSSHDGDVLSTG